MLMGRQKWEPSMPPWCSWIFVSQILNIKLDCACVSAKLLQSCPALCNPMDCLHQSYLSMGFSRQEHWSGLPCAPPGDLPNPGIKPASPAVAGRFFTQWAIREASHVSCTYLFSRYLLNANCFTCIVLFKSYNTRSKVQLFPHFIDEVTKT